MALDSGSAVASGSAIPYGEYQLIITTPRPVHGWPRRLRPPRAIRGPRSACIVGVEASCFVGLLMDGVPFGFDALLDEDDDGPVEAETGVLDVPKVIVVPGATV